jgi:protocatechuate 3,4-dioxygenase alpha subunit
MKLKQTPSQTIGPYFAYALTPGQYGYRFKDLCGPDLVHGEVAGDRIVVRGKVLDGKGQTVSDAMIEIWQTDAAGQYPAADDPNFRGFGRCGTGTFDDNRFEFHTVKPGMIGDQAPYIEVIVFMRGLLAHLYTRIYFPEEEAANEADRFLSSVEPKRRPTLVAVRAVEDGRVVYQFDIHLQGELETVFIDL